GGGAAAAPARPPRLPWGLKEAGDERDGRVPVRGGEIPHRRRTRRGVDLPLPHVPEGDRRTVRALCGRAEGRGRVDAWPAETVPELEQGAARLLRRLRHPADLPVRGPRDRPHTRRAGPA